MEILGIEQEKCIQCKSCVQDCPAKLFHVTGGEDAEATIYFNDIHGSCIKCGHCIATCPKDAIKFKAPDSPMTWEGIENPSSLVSYDTLLNFLRARRSIRQYKQEPVSDEDINAVLEAMRYAPSASNAQSWSYIVITDPVKKQLLVEETIQTFKLLRKLLKLSWLIKPFLSSNLKKTVSDPSTKHSLDRILSEYNAGRDPIFHSAPCVVILYSPSYGHMAGCDAGLAFMHGMLAAQSRGLGTCWIGYVQEILFRSKKTREWLGIPKKQKPWGVMTLGHPAVKYHRVPMRNALRVTRLSE
ncbi:MAG: nitroreductase family protein [Candidatus Helarchaeota archaeon]